MNASRKTLPSRAAAGAFFLGVLVLCMLDAAPAAAQVPGDANNSGTLDDDDVTQIVNDLLELATPPGNTDANSDGSTNVADVVRVRTTLDATPITINFRDYFILSQNSFWDYTDGVVGGDTDAFRWTVLAGTVNIPAGGVATQIQTDAVDTDDARHLSRDFWQEGMNGDIFFAGFHQGQATSALPVQDIFMDTPMLIGTDGMSIGAEFMNTSSATVQTALGSVTGTVNATSRFTGVVDSLTVPLGTFTEVLRMEIDIEGVVAVPPVGNVTIPITTSTFFLKEGVGVISHDQEPDPNDADLLLLSGGQVAGTTIVPSR